MADNKKRGLDLKGHEEFHGLSDAAEIITEKRPWLIRGPLYVLISLIVTVVVFAWVTEVDEVVKAQGVLRPDAQEVEVKNLVKGRLIYLGPKVGDLVSKGDKLFEIVNEDMQLALTLNVEKRKAIDDRIAQKKRQIALLESQKEANLKVADTNIRLAELSYEKIKTDKADRLRELEMSVSLNATRLEQMDDLIAKNEAWLKEGRVTRHELDRLRMERPNLNFALQESRQKLDEERQNSEELRLGEQKILLEKDNREDTRLRFVAQKNALEEDVERLLNEQQQLATEHATLSQNLERSVYTAPISGVITDRLLPHTGVPVSEGDTLYRLSPVTSTLKLVAQVKDKDRAHLREGQKAHLKVTAFPHREFGMLAGEIRYINPDAREQSGQLVYPVHIQLTDTRGLDIRAGMSVEVEVVKRRRRVITIIRDKLLNVVDV